MVQFTDFKQMLATAILINVCKLSSEIRAWEVSFCVEAMPHRFSFYFMQ